MNKLPVSEGSLTRPQTIVKREAAGIEAFFRGEISRSHGPLGPHHPDLTAGVSENLRYAPASFAAAVPAPDVMRPSFGPQYDTCPSFNSNTWEMDRGIRSATCVT